MNRNIVETCTSYTKYALHDATNIMVAKTTTKIYVQRISITLGKFEDAKRVSRRHKSTDNTMTTERKRILDKHWSTKYLTEN